MEKHSITGEKMKNIKYLSIIAAALCLGLLGCQKNDNTNSAANNANKTATNANANAKPETTETKTESGPTGSLATPTDAYKTAYELRKKKDIEGLKKVMSKDILDFLTMMGEDDKKSLDDMLREMCDKPQAPTNESRNEKITGNTATLEYPDDKGNWKTMDLVKVGNDWKVGPPKGPMKSDGPQKKP